MDLSSNKHCALCFLFSGLHNQQNVQLFMIHNFPFQTFELLISIQSFAHLIGSSC